MSLGLEAPPTAPTGVVDRRRGFLPGGWAYIAMVGFYPLWWALGLGAFTWTVLAVPMALQLYLRRPIRVPRGAGVLALFLLCVAVSVIQIDSPDRLAGYLLRTSYYLALAVTWLYLVNSGDRLSSQRILRALVVLWMASIVGGYLGLISPGTSWTGPAATVIPENLRDNELIHDLVTPGFAEVTDVVGVQISRPKAPYTYTNGWGSAMALLTPLALAALASRDFSAAWKRAIRLGLLVSAAPIILSLNRGLWALLLLAGLYVIVRRSPGGRSRSTALIFLALLGIATTVIATPVGDPIRESLGTRSEDSNARRTIIYEETFERTLESPVVGYGAPRPSERTEQAVGSHGQLWTVMFSHGFLAAALFLGFLFSLAWQSRNPTSMTGTWCHVALVVGLVQVLFYGQLPHQLFIIVSAAAVAHRERQLTPA